MKIIISHDVDHLYTTDHITRDLILPKLWIRSGLHFLKGKISIRTFGYRLRSIFEKRLNRIEEVMELDRKYGVPSVFFFGMKSGLGMSYKKEEAQKYIQVVKESGFDIGVHGIEFEMQTGITKEYECFKQESKIDKFGIRTHYVRYDEDTFEKMSKAGYLYDTSQFNKKCLEIKAPYKINDMWEFPLHIMDGYIMPPGNLKQGQENTKKAIAEAKRLHMPYCTILYHDYQYNEYTYPAEKAWYQWLLEYLKEEEYEFISYRDAIMELEEEQSGRYNEVCK